MKKLIGIFLAFNITHLCFCQNSSLETKENKLNSALEFNNMFAADSTTNLICSEYETFIKLLRELTIVKSNEDGELYLLNQNHSSSLDSVVNRSLYEPINIEQKDILTILSAKESSKKDSIENAFFHQFVNSLLKIDSEYSIGNVLLKSIYGNLEIRKVSGSMLADYGILKLQMGTKPENGSIYLNSEYLGEVPDAINGILVHCKKRYNLEIVSGEEVVCQFAFYIESPKLLTRSCD